MFAGQTSLSSSNISANGNVNLNAAGGDVIVYNGTRTIEEKMKAKREVLARISQRNFKAIQRDTFSKVAKNTGNWVFCNSEFCEWQTKSTGLFWGTGIAGAGKTFLSSIVINDLESRAKANPTTTVIFSYCRFEDSLTEYDILASLLRQLAENSESIYGYVETNFEDFATGDSEALLQADILAALKTGLMNFEKTFIVLDAVDELTDEVRHRLLEVLLDLPALIFLTSRPIQLMDGMKPDFFIHAHEEEVKAFVREELQRLPKLRGLLKGKPSVMEEVASSIEQKSTGMFLLARLQLNALRNVMTIKKLVATVKNLPDTISELYQATLQRINEQSDDEKEMAYNALVWVTHSHRPLKVQELLYAIAASPDSDSLDSDDLISESTLLSICYGLITIEQENNIVRLSHYTVHEFFMSYSEGHFAMPHWRIADLCASCLSTFTSGGKDWPLHASAFQTLEKKCDIWSYACVFFGYHLQLATRQSPSKVLSLHVVKLLQNSQFLPLQVREGDYRWCDYGSAIHFAAKNGILQAFHFLHHPRNAKSQLGITPLMFASANGHLQIAQCLLDGGDVDINLGETSPSGSALSRACIHGHKDIVKHLLTRPELNVNVKFGGKFILHAIIQHGNRNSTSQLEILELLLKHPNLQVDSVDHQMSTILHDAVVYGSNDIVHLLLQNGCVHLINTKNYFGHTPLDVAKVKHKKEICQTLQDFGGQEGIASLLDSSPIQSRSLAFAQGKAPNRCFPPFPPINEHTPIAPPHPFINQGPQNYFFTPSYNFPFIQALPASHGSVPLIQDMAHFPATSSVPIMQRPASFSTSQTAPAGVPILPRPASFSTTQTAPVSVPIVQPRAQSLIYPMTQPTFLPAPPSVPMHAYGTGSWPAIPSQAGRLNSVVNYPISQVNHGTAPTMHPFTTGFPVTHPRTSSTMAQPPPGVLNTNSSVGIGFHSFNEIQGHVQSGSGMTSGAPYVRNFSLKHSHSLTALVASAEIISREEEEKQMGTITE